MIVEGTCLVNGSDVRGRFLGFLRLVGIMMV
jgi:hypothetical protein